MGFQNVGHGGWFWCILKEGLAELDAALALCQGQHWQSWQAKAVIRKLQTDSSAVAKARCGRRIMRTSLDRTPKKLTYNIQQSPNGHISCLEFVWGIPDFRAPFGSSYGEDHSVQGSTLGPPIL